MQREFVWFLFLQEASFLTRASFSTKKKLFFYLVIFCGLNKISSLCAFLLLILISHHSSPSIGINDVSFWRKSNRRTSLYIWFRDVLCHKHQWVTYWYSQLVWEILSDYRAIQEVCNKLVKLCNWSILEGFLFEHKQLLGFSTYIFREWVEKGLF